MVSIAAAMIAVTGAGPAAAHSKLISSSPADGATLTTAPTEVSFTFDEALLPGTSTIAITDADGNVVQSQKVQPDGNTIRAPWPETASAGTYQAAYRIVSADGHPVSGAILITIEAGASTSPVTSAGSGKPSADAAPVTVEAATPSTEEPPANVRGGGSDWLIIAASVGLIVVGGAALLWRFRR